MTDDRLISAGELRGILEDHEGNLSSAIVAISGHDSLRALADHLHHSSKTLSECLRGGSPLFGVRTLVEVELGLETGSLGTLIDET
jgi:hypothetical protein